MDVPGFKTNLELLLVLIKASTCGASKVDNSKIDFFRRIGWAIDGEVWNLTFPLRDVNNDFFSLKPFDLNIFLYTCLSLCKTFCFQEDKI